MSKVRAGVQGERDALQLRVRDWGSAVRWIIPETRESLA